MNPGGSSEALYRQQVILWMAMLASVVMYFVVVKMVPATPSVDNPLFAYVGIGIGVCLVATSIPLRNHFLARARGGMPGLYRLAVIVPIVFCEAAALLGVVVWFLTASPQYYWNLIIGVLGMLMHFPKRAE